MIVTLAGHVDHGKTSLVRRLTGVNTDRLAEEQRRGLTIDLGFAYVATPTTPMGFVDVPGHHRFIHNMVAGVASEQHALLVIAADDGPMPQSREHLAIMQLLGMQSGVIAITKCDRVPASRLQAVQAEIDDLVAGSFLEDAPRFLTSAETGAGIDELLAHLVSVHQAHRVVARDRRFRLAIDRAFTIKGAGVVVTGTVHAGTVRPEDELVLYPGGQPVRVRTIHAQNQPAISAVVGDRCALNISGVDRNQVERGHWLSAPPATGHRRLTVKLQVLADFPRAVRHWTPVHAYLATAHTTGRLALLHSGAARPGTEVLAELVADEPLLARHGDRLVLRDQSLDLTLGGGVVISNREPRGRRRDPQHLAELNACDTDDPVLCLRSLLALGPVHIPTWRDNWDLTDAAWNATLATSDCKLVDSYAIATPLWERWRDELLREAETRHANDASLQGLKANEFTTDVPGSFRAALLNELVAAGKLKLEGNLFATPRHEVLLSATEARLLERLSRQLTQEQPPSLGDISKATRIPLAELQRDLKPLLGKGKLVRVNDKRVFLPEQVLSLAQLARQLSDAGPFNVRQFRDACGMGRNVVIELLEYFDSRGYTRRTGDTRIVVGEIDRLKLA